MFSDESIQTIQKSVQLIHKQRV